jgi:Sigma-70 region 2
MLRTRPGASGDTRVTQASPTGARLDQTCTIMTAALNAEQAAARYGAAAQPASEPICDLADSAAIRASLTQPEQFAVLYDKYATILHRYAGRSVGDDAADDVVAATFLAAFAARRRYDLERASARPWLFGILTKEIAPASDRDGSFACPRTVLVRRADRWPCRPGR